MTNRQENQKARNDGKSGVPFSWPPIIAGTVDPLRMGKVQ